MDDLEQYVIDSLVADLERNQERATYLLGDGSQRVVVTLQADEWSDVRDDEDWIGKVAECSRGGWFGHSERPEGFDGFARKVRDDRGYVYWWQPPVDAVGNDALLTELRRDLVDILSFGYLSGVMVLERQCEFGGWHEVGSSCIGMLHPVNVDLAMIVSELHSQIHDCNEVSV